jgi:putative sterol carrier protein
MTMPTATEDLFAALGRRRHDPLMRRVAGTIRVDLSRAGKTDRWFIVIDHGDIVVSRGNRAADCKLRTDADLFEKIATGEANALAALLRGALTVEGDVELLMLFQQLLPAPATASAAGRRAP